MKALLAGGFLLGLTAAGFAQSKVDISSVSLQVTGSIAYLTVNYSAVCPDEIFKMPTSIVGNQVTQRIFLGRRPTTYCLEPSGFEPEPATAVIALGSFAPGDYAFTLFNGRFNSFIESTNVFTVTASPTIKASAVAPGKVALHVSGTSNVVYSLQSSTMLTNWSTLSTKIGGPFTATNTPAQTMFYRVLVNDQVPSSP
jgi:hypothetical protein